MILVDTNVLIDVITRDATWFDWSREKLETLSAGNLFLINDIIYAELSARFESEALLREAIEIIHVVIERLSQQSLFLAGQAFARYRKAGGPQSSILADFFIGAHASVAQLPILTRDTRRYRTHFPDVELIAPD